MASTREKQRARLLAMMGAENVPLHEELQAELRAVIAAGRENPSEAAIIADAFLDRVEEQTTVERMNQFLPPSGRKGLQWGAAMAVAAAVLLVCIVLRVPAGISIAGVVLALCVVSWLRWFSDWSYEQRCAREEQHWLNGPRPEVVVRMYGKDAVLSRDASRLRALGYRMISQQRVSGSTRVTFQLEHDS